MQGTEAFLLAVAGLVVGVFFLARARSAQALLQKEREAVSKLQGQLEAVRNQRETDVKKMAGHASEVAELRKRLEKAKRRAAQASPQKGKLETASALSEREAELEEARQARDEARQEAQALSGELSRLRKASGAPVPSVEKPLLDNAAVENLQRELETAKSTLAGVHAENESREKAYKKLKRKVENQELLYTSVRSELEAKKDRLRTQQEELERLMALKAILHDKSAAPVAETAEIESASTEVETSS